MDAIRYLLKALTNKFVLALAVAAVWMVFFDSYNLLSQRKRSAKIAEVEDNIRFYEGEVLRLAQEEYQLRNNPAEMEKLARERYHMKRPGEDIFVLDAGGGR